jgi:hypothetical protein
MTAQSVESAVPRLLRDLAPQVLGAVELFLREFRR